MTPFTSVNLSSPNVVLQELPANKEDECAPYSDPGSMK